MGVASCDAAEWAVARALPVSDSAGAEQIPINGQQKTRIPSRDTPSHRGGVDLGMND
jgi:hypothetical protein